MLTVFIASAKDSLRKRHRGQDDFIGHYIPKADPPSVGAHSKGDKDRLGQHCWFLAVCQRYRHHEYLSCLCR